MAISTNPKPTIYRNLYVACNLGSLLTFHEENLGVRVVVHPYAERTKLLPFVLLLVDKTVIQAMESYFCLKMNLLCAAVSAQAIFYFHLKLSIATVTHNDPE